MILILMSTLFGDKETIELRGDSLCLTQKKVSFSVKIDEIVNIELLELNRELVIETKGTRFSYKTYRFGKKSIEKFFKENGLLIKNSMQPIS